MCIEETFIGTATEIREFLCRKWCKAHRISEDKWNKISTSTFNGVKIRIVDTDIVLEFWAGSSGCNFMAVDKTGGCHNFDNTKERMYEVLTTEHKSAQ